MKNNEFRSLLSIAGLTGTLSSTRDNPYKDNLGKPYEYISGIFVIGAEGDRRGSGGNLSTRDKLCKDNWESRDCYSGLICYLCMSMVAVRHSRSNHYSSFGVGDKSLIYNTLINAIGALPHSAMRLSCILL